MQNQPSEQTTSRPPAPEAPQQQSNQPQSDQGKPGGYGKRPLWQWVVLYIIVGIIVYGLIYYFFMRGDGGSGGGITY